MELFLYGKDADLSPATGRPRLQSHAGPGPHGPTAAPAVMPLHRVTKARQPSPRRALGLQQRAQQAPLGHSWKVKACRAFQSKQKATRSGAPGLSSPIRRYAGAPFAGRCTTESTDTAGRAAASFSLDP
eukprot:CAMPEP_0206013434 /NCGR_PEP_ID=MMETSP1464-20131121/16484_1 /ASSEMBLY_ACC=CAM_ASM_001124 /TAXON_ID=119497 /ORGANISM="Exanthemachrysis gayraliae, Strain RCC1523" /LENGTH=128 /DNA_ID=CAMNT_0053387153 /DNA_START=76 /DNA_END=462 /DNA_ORIENTATION=-